MTNKLTTKKLVWLLIAVNIFHLALWTYIGAQKVDYHIDEYLTFGQANNYRAFAYTFTNGEVYPVDIIDAWRAVDSNHSFDFAIPFNSTAFEGDPSNPPFYLMLVHFVYSLVPDYFSNWPALVINFVALTLTAYSVFFIAREIWADDLAALFVMAVFGTMYGVVNMAVYLRTYCLLMLWAGLLVLWHLREKKNHLFLVLLAVFGGITHYYFFVLLAFTALYYGISLIIAKKWGAIWLYIGSMLIAAGLFLLAYPYAFSDYAYEYGRYAQKSADYVHFLRAISGYARVFFEGICRETPLFVLGLLAIIAAGVFFFIKRRQIPRAQTKQLLFIVVPALLYLLTIAKIAPYYPNILEKYVSIILPSMGIAFWGLLYQSVKITPPRFLGVSRLQERWRGLVMATVVLAILLLGLRRTAYLPYFCYPHRPAYHEMYAACLPEGNNVGVLYVYDTYQIGVVMHSQVLKEAKYLQVLRYKNLDRYTDFPGDGNIILLVSGDVAASGADIARQMGAISGKTSAAVIGYAVDAEAWLLE